MPEPATKDEEMARTPIKAARAGFGGAAGRRVPDHIASALDCGDLVMLVDRNGEDRGRGGFVGIAALMQPRNVTRMAVHGRGLLSVVVDHIAAARLGLTHMPCEVSKREGSPYFLTSIEAADCDGTGISAADRAMTMREAGAPNADPGAVRSPGHVMPILVSASRRQRGNMAQTAYWLIRDATPYDVAAWCDVLNDSGELASAAECIRLARSMGLPVAMVSEASAASRGI